MSRTCPHCGYTPPSLWEQNLSVCTYCGRMKYSLGGCIIKLIVIFAILSVIGMIFGS